MNRFQWAVVVVALLAIVGLSTVAIFSIPQQTPVERERCRDAIEDWYEIKHVDRVASPGARGPYTVERPARQHLAPPRSQKEGAQ